MEVPRADSSIRNPLLFLEEDSESGIDNCVMVHSFDFSDIFRHGTRSDAVGLDGDPTGT